MALGGNPDQTGYVKKSVLVNIIRKQFELTFNIEEFLDITSEASELDYATFSNIFAQALEKSNIMSMSRTSLYGSDKMCVKVG